MIDERRLSMASSDMKRDRSRYQSAAFKAVVCLAAVLAATWLTYEFWRLLFQTGRMGAVDLKLRLMEVQGWASGRPIYGELSNAVYPPASYLMLWPLLGWLEVPAARWLWAFFTAFALWGMVVLTIRHSAAVSGRERLFMALTPLAAYATGASIGNGQLGIPVVLCLMYGLPMLGEKNRSWSRDALIAILFVLALVKPSLSAFFFWIVLFAAGGIRPAALVCAGYAFLTFTASLLQHKNAFQLLWVWFNRGMAGAAFGAAKGEGSIMVRGEGGVRITSINLHSLLSVFKLGDYNALATLAILLLLGVWIYRHRRCPIWTLMGLTALATRFCTYHGWYDDVLLLLPLIALLRIVKQEEPEAWNVRSTAGLLFALMWISLLAPGGIYTLPHPWNNFYAVGQALIWIAVICYLVYYAHRRLDQGALGSVHKPGAPDPGRGPHA